MNSQDHKSQTSAPTSGAHFDVLDGLRGIAVLFVLLSHTSNLGYYLFPGLDFRGSGKPGVFLFFILSAFLLTRAIMVAEKGAFTGKYWLQYGQRRVFRIFPLYSLYLIVSVSTTYLFAKFGFAMQGLPLPITMELFWQHLFLQIGFGITWSIPVEFKYYLILPFAALLFRYSLRFGPLALCLVGGGLVVLTQVLFPQAKAPVNSPDVSHYIVIFILGGTAAGLDLALRSATHQALTKARILFRILAVLSAILITLSLPAVWSAVFEPVANGEFHNQFIFYGLVWSVLLLYLINFDTSFIKELMVSAPMRYLGKISFSLYLLHMPVIDLIKPLELNAFVGAWLIIIASILISHLSYHLIEKPFLRIRIFAR